MTQPSQAETVDQSPEEEARELVRGIFEDPGILETARELGRHSVLDGEEIIEIDGSSFGYPSLYARRIGSSNSNGTFDPDSTRIIDCRVALGEQQTDLKVSNIGFGTPPRIDEAFTGVYGSRKEDLSVATKVVEGVLEQYRINPLAEVVKLTESVFDDAESIGRGASERRHIKKLRDDGTIELELFEVGHEGYKASDYLRFERSDDWDGGLLEPRYVKSLNIFGRLGSLGHGVILMRDYGSGPRRFRVLLADFIMYSDQKDTGNAAVIDLGLAKETIEEVVKNLRTTDGEG